MLRGLQGPEQRGLQRAREVFPGRVITQVSVTGSRGRASRARELRSQGMEVTFGMGFSRISRERGALSLGREGTGKRYSQDVCRAISCRYTSVEIFSAEIQPRKARCSRKEKEARVPLAVVSEFCLFLTF